MALFRYVYILESVAKQSQFYVGLTENLQSRLAKHNSGAVSHTSKHLPWKIKTALAFSDHQRAALFERYLKSSSGRAFAKKHF